MVRLNKVAQKNVMGPVLGVRDIGSAAAVFVICEVAAIGFMVLMGKPSYHIMIMIVLFSISNTVSVSFSGLKRALLVLVRLHHNYHGLVIRRAETCS